MGADEIQILGVEMVVRRWIGSFGEPVPVEAEASQMSLFDLLPEAEPMNPLFQPGMITRHEQKEGQEAAERQIACLVPAESVEGDRAEQRGHEQDQAPACQGGTGSMALYEQSCSSTKQPLQRLFSRKSFWGALVILHGRFDLTGWACLRQ